MLDKLKNNVSIVLIGNGIGFGFGYLSRVIPARLLSPDSYGQFVFGLTLVVTFSLLTRLGLRKYLARELAIKEDWKKYRDSIIMIAIPSIILPIIYLYSSRYMPFLGGNAKRVSYIFLIGLPFLTLHQLNIGAYQGRNDPIAKSLVHDIIYKILIVVLIMAFVYLSPTELAASIGWLSATIITAITGTSIIIRRYNIEINDFKSNFPNTDEVKSILQFSLPLILVTASWRLLQEADNILIQVYLNSSKLGIYDAGFTTARINLILLWSIGFLSLPKLSKLHAEKKMDSAKSIYIATSEWLAVISTPVYFAGIFFAEDILILTFGPSYSDGALVLQLILSAFYIHTLSGPNREILTAYSNTRLLSYVVLSSVIVNIILNIGLIPIFGIAGAGISSLLAFYYMNIGINCIICYKYELNPLTMSSIVLYIITGAIYIICNLFGLLTWPLGAISITLIVICVFILIGSYTNYLEMPPIKFLNSFE